MELFIIRHGQSDNNALPNIRDRSVDPPLTELGKRQAEMLARYLAGGETHDVLDSGNMKFQMRQGFGITSLFTSPMYRSLQTVEPVGKSLGLEPQVWVDIHEEGGMFLSSGGDEVLVGYPGRTRTEILSEFPDYQLPTNISESGWWNKGHEDPPSILTRASKVSEQLREMAAKEDRVAIITHGRFMNTLLNMLFGLGDQIYYLHHNTAISRIYIEGSETFEVQYLNRVDHLSPEFVS